MNQRKDSGPSSHGVSGPSGSADAFGHWLIHHAALRAPDSLRERLQEEWLADMAARSSTLSRLRFAAGCCWATCVIAYEQRLSLAPAADSVTGSKLVAAFGQFNWGNVSRRSSTLFLILSLHVAVFYVVMSSISQTHTSSIPDPLVNSTVDKQRPPEPPPMLPGVKFSGVTLAVPNRPEIDIPVDVDRSNDVTAEFHEGAGVVLPPQAPAQTVPVARVQGGPGAGFPNTDDFYPPAAIRAEESGAVTMQVCVDTKGMLNAAPTTLQGAGSARLDEAALKLARAASGHYRPTTEDGRPVDSCYPIRVRFQLKR
jgi:periplasmic protein TonB